jgi:GNAT superfamily N-acetyltransferase
VDQPGPGYIGSMRVTLRPAHDDDIDWIDFLYESVMRPHVERTHAWDPEIFRATFEADLTMVVVVDGDDLGMLEVEHRPDCVVLRDIQLDPMVQGLGIGGGLVRGVQEQGRARGVPVRLRVLAGNPARRLYARLGFVPYDEEPHATWMEWWP